MIWLTNAQSKILVQYAINASPEEACGLIVGKDGQVKEIIPTSNVADDPTCRYQIDPAVLALQLPRLEREGLDLLAFYHSHPNHDAIPSPVDIREAAYPNTAYVIIGLKNNEATLAAWRIRQGIVEPVILHLGDTEPDFEDTKLSPLQQIAVLLSAFIATGLLIIISLNLLPAAPPIP